MVPDRTHGARLTWQVFFPAEPSHWACLGDSSVSHVTVYGRDVCKKVLVSCGSLSSRDVLSFPPAVLGSTDIPYSPCVDACVSSLPSHWLPS